MRLRRALAALGSAAGVTLTAGALVAGPASAAPSAPAPPAMTPAATVTKLSLSQPQVTFGNEAIEQFSVLVTSATGDTPTGSVTVKAGDISICAITLAGTGSGSCALTASALPAGTYQVVASYPGDIAHIYSNSPPVILTVNPEPTTTALRLSASTVTFGQEHSGPLFVKTVPISGGTATGTFAIMAGSNTVCTGILAGGAGSCAMPDQALPPGSYQLSASYNGDANYAASASAPQFITVTPG